MKLFTKDTTSLFTSFLHNEMWTIHKRKMWVSLKNILLIIYIFIFKNLMSQCSPLNPSIFSENWILDSLELDWPIWSKFPLVENQPNQSHWFTLTTLINSSFNRKKKSELNYERKKNSEWWIKSNIYFTVWFI